MVPTMKKGKEVAFDFCFWWGCYSTKQKLQTRSGKKQNQIWPIIETTYKYPVKNSMIIFYENSWIIKNPNLGKPQKCMYHVKKVETIKDSFEWLS